ETRAIAPLSRWTQEGCSGRRRSKCLPMAGVSYGPRGALGDTDSAAPPHPTIVTCAAARGLALVRLGGLSKQIAGALFPLPHWTHAQGPGSHRTQTSIRTRAAGTGSAHPGRKAHPSRSLSSNPHSENRAPGPNLDGALLSLSASWKRCGRYAVER